MPDSQPSDEAPRKRVRIQRRRLGTIQYVQDQGEFGFITAEDFRDDVFFHHTVWQDANGSEESKADVTGDQHSTSTGQASHRSSESKPLPKSLLDTWVEFEIDEDHFAAEKKLRATVVRPSNRPQGKKLSGRDATFKIVTHHPNARRKRPSWRGKKQ